MLRTAVLPPTVKPVLTAGDPQVSAAGCRLAIHDEVFNRLGYIMAEKSTHWDWERDHLFRY